MRLKFLDIAKGLAIIMVVVGHFFPSSSPHWYVLMRQVIYSFHMPLFLFISGFVYMYTWKEQSYGSFLFSKVKRIVIPYFVVSLLFIFIKFIPQFFGIYVKNPVTLMSFVRIFYYPEAAVSFWYLWALWWFYMITPLMKSRWVRVVALVAAVAVSYIPLEVTGVFALDKVKEMYGYFMLGVVAADWREMLAPLKYMRSWVIYALWGLLVYVWLLHDIHMGFLLAVSGTSVVLRLAADMVPIIEKGRCRWLESVSASSYMIYLLHPVFLAAVMAVLHEVRFPLSSDPLFVPVAAAACFFGTAGPMFVRKILSRFSLRHIPRGNRRIGVRNIHTAE